MSLLLPDIINAPITIGGLPGIPGDPGGPIGPDGLSAYEVAVVNGFVGTEPEWLISLIGPQGEPGIDGEDGITPTIEDRIGFGIKSVDSISSGLIHGYKTVPFNCTIKGWYIESDVVGDIEVDVQIGIITPTSVVGAGTKPNLVNQTSNSSASPDWDTLTLSEGDQLVFNVQAGSTINQVILTLDIESV